MMNIKKQIMALVMIATIAGIAACKKNNGFNTVISGDMTKPDIVKNIKVDDFNGGSFITYDLPSSANILYVLAKYKISDNVSREAKSSYYQDTIVVNGFAKEQPYEVTLYTVTRANVMSDPIKVTVNPKTPVYKLVRPSLTLSADFGGVNVTGENPTGDEIGVVILSYNDNTRSMEIQDQYFTKADIINYSVRGFKSEDHQFGVYVTDKWGNISDTLKQNLTPLYEEALDKTKFSTLPLNTDTPIDFGWVTPNLWDTRPDGAGWHTRFGESLPFTCSFGIGKSYKLSRFVLYERIGSGFTYNYGNPKEFTLWGTNSTTPQDIKLPVTSDEGTMVGDWINLGNFKYPDPPSNNPPGTTTSADEDFVKRGVNFQVPFQAPPVKYLRVAVATTWGNVAAAHIMEITPFGTPQ